MERLTSRGEAQLRSDTMSRTNCKIVQFSPPALDTLARDVEKTTRVSILRRVEVKVMRVKEAE